MRVGKEAEYEIYIVLGATVTVGKNIVGSELLNHLTFSNRGFKVWISVGRPALRCDRNLSAGSFRGY